MPGEMSCPACGAPVDSSHRFEDYINCPWCNTQSYVGDSTKAISAESGEDVHATLTDNFSRFHTGQRGYIRWNNDVSEWIITGNIMYEYDGGYWFEWYIDIGGQGYWLQEDEGVYILFIEVPIVDYSIVQMLHQLAKTENDELRVGKLLRPLYNDMGTWTMFEYGNAFVSSSEGSLPSPVRKGHKVIYIDGAGDGVRFSLEIDENGQSASLCKGWPLNYEQIQTEDEPNPKDTVGAF
ncbi:DUF4178 domain-containing protein [Myxococcota bacterium]|nr:DUF4178 domain-containing protein [Myxococcota bacterium]MBU1380087.1 DUF4178 domain-containing protein [Myxococcota bacterium]MBU1495545.1 DUF4178 domain-containing protein [Myxococcota bacterium]